MTRNVLRGGCHCKAISVQFSTGVAAADLPLRECQCTFCRKHGARTTADPAGQLVISVSAGISRYRWALATADFLVCPRCGVYVAAVLTEGPAAWGVVNTRVFDDPHAFDRAAAAVSYDQEDVAARIARRKLHWTPAHLIEL